MPTIPPPYRPYDVQDDTAPARTRKSGAVRIPDYYPELDHLPPPVPMRIESPEGGIFGDLYLTVPGWLKAGKQYIDGQTQLQVKPVPQLAGTVLAGPVDGSAAIPAFRKLTRGDLPWLDTTYTQVGDTANLVVQLSQLQIAISDGLRDVRQNLADMQSEFDLDLSGLGNDLSNLTDTVDQHGTNLDNTSQGWQDAVSQMQTDLANAVARTSAAWDTATSAASGVLKNAQDMLDGFFNLNTLLTSETNARTSAITGLQGSILQEASDRHAAVVAEANERNSAIAQEVSERNLAIAGETNNRKAALQAEAQARDLLATQIRGSYEGSDVENVVTGLFASERIARSTQYEGLAQQLTLLSAGVSGSFDPGIIWYFTNDAEGWTDNLGGPVYAASWIQPAAGTAPELTSPGGLTLSGTEYGEFRARIRKHGAPDWAGQLWWRDVADGAWQGPVALTEPEYDANDIATLSHEMGWSGNVVQLKLQLSTTQSASIGFEIDWIAVGRAAPGASRAELANEATTRATQDANLATQISVLDASLTNLDGSVGANSTAIDQLQVDNTRQDGDITTNSQAITALQSRMPAGTGKVASASALSTLDTTVSQQGDTLTAQGNSITALQARMPTGTGSVASADALDSLSTTVTSQGGSITTNANAITALQTRAGNIEASVTNESAARSSGDQANASSISTLTTKVNGNTASITNVQTSVNGVLAKAGVTLDVNGYVTGWALNNNGSSGTMKILASKFEVSAPGGGARTEFSNGSWKVYDSAGVLRVQLGILS